MPDGSIRRTLIAPKTHQAKQARAWKAKTEAAKIRHDLNLTQADFATIRKWERGTGQPSGAAKTLLIVARQHPEVIREALAADQG